MSTALPTHRLGPRLAGLWRGLRWYAEGVLGADAYRKYLDHHARTRPDLPPMTERAFWRDHHAWQDRNPQGRCC